MSRVSSLAINAADHLVAKGRLDAAASILKNYLSTNAAMPEILQRLARILLAQGRSAEAVPYLQQALTVFKDADVQEPGQDIQLQRDVLQLHGNNGSAKSEVVTLDAESS